MHARFMAERRAPREAVPPRRLQAHHAVSIHMLRRHLIHAERVVCSVGKHVYLGVEQHRYLS